MCNNSEECYIVLVLINIVFIQISMKENYTLQTDSILKWQLCEGCMVKRKIIVIANVIFWS